MGTASGPEPRGTPGWRHAEAKDETALRAIVEPRETYATGFTSRVIDKDGRLARLKSGKGGLYLFEEEADLGRPPEAKATVLLSSSGTAFPVLSGTYDDGGPPAVSVLTGLKRAKTVRAYSPGACVGARAHVDALERALDWEHALCIDYDAMFIAPGELIASAIASGAPERSASGAVRSSRADVPPTGRAEYWRATPDDLDDLYPLAADYERTEVMTELHVFDPIACRAAQARSLKLQIVYLAIVGGRVVARAQTNARGWSYDQVGGVFVVPEYRGSGIGRGVVSALVAEIASKGRGVSLFVKKSNGTARSLYLSMGFSMARDYRVSYFA